MSVLTEFAMFPTDKGASVSKHVSKIISMIRESGFSYQLTAMGTIIEGDTDAVFDLIKKCQKHLASKAERVYTVIKIDDKVGKTGQLKHKVDSVKQKIDGDVNSV